jgi:hypothetical protein
LLTVSLRLMILAVVVVLGSRHETACRTAFALPFRKRKQKLFDECVLTEDKRELLATSNSAVVLG